MSVRSEEYFARQTTLRDIGSKGLQRLQSSRVAVVGVGGIGSSTAYYLSKSGIGQLRLIDQDVVEPSNLQRLHCAGPVDLYHPKAEVLASGLSKVHSWCKIEPVLETLTAGNVDQLLDGVNVILDGLDNFRTRYILNRYAVTTRIPYLFTSAIGEQSHIALLKPPETPCLECVMPEVTDRREESCQVIGVTPTITGLTGAVAAGVTVRLLLGFSTGLAGKLLTIDIAGTDFLLSKLSRRDGCPSCSQPNRTRHDARRTATLLCGERTANVLPEENLDLDLSSVSRKILPEKLLALTNSVVVFSKRGATVSLFRNGRTLISGIEGEEQALRMAREVWREILDKAPIQS